MRLESGGVVAWSECVADPDPFYSYETTTTASHVIRDFLLPTFEPRITLGEFEGASVASAATAWRRRRWRTRSSSCSPS